MKLGLQIGNVIFGLFNTISALTDNSDNGFEKNLEAFEKNQIAV